MPIRWPKSSQYQHGYRAALQPLNSEELRLVDKHCPWVAFGHAWNAVVKHRLANLEEGDWPCS